jgi:hypothetical protein
MSIIPSFCPNKQVAPAAPTSPVSGSTAIIENVSCEYDKVLIKKINANKSLFIHTIFVNLTTSTAFL